MIVHVNMVDVLTGTDEWKIGGFSMSNAYEKINSFLERLSTKCQPLFRQLY